MHTLSLRPRWFLVNAAIVALVIVLAALHHPTAPSAFAPQFGQPAGPAAGNGPLTVDAAVVAEALGITPAALLAEIGRRTPLQAIIAARGHSDEDVVNAITAQLRQQLDPAVAAGNLTATTEQRQLEQRAQDVRSAIQRNTLRVVANPAP